MKKELLLSLFSLLSISSFCQKIRLSDTTNQWKVFYYSCVGDLGSSFNISRYSTDTIYHGIAYKVLQDGYYTSFIREDTTAKKIFAIRIVNWIQPTSGPDTAEQLLYDYTLNIGDTFRCAVATHYVSSIDSVIINSTWHKTWLLLPFSCIGCPSSYTAFPYCVIEGIGSTFAPLTPLYPMHFYESCIALTCFNNRGTTPVLSHTVGAYFNNSTSCSLTFGLDVNSTVINNNIAWIYPNPVIADLSITASYSITTVTISNLLGKTLYSQQYNAEKVQLDVADLPAGMYLIRINGTEVRKFVKE